MFIDFEGNLSLKKKKELKEAAEFFAYKLLDPRTVRNINLTIELDKNLETQGMCYSEDDTKNPRNFVISIRDKIGDDDIIQTLAHEMVHVKQYAKNELYKSLRMYKGKTTLNSIWQGAPWKPKSREDPYWDSPWELDAYGREIGLYRRWMER